MVRFKGRSAQSLNVSFSDEERCEDDMIILEIICGQVFFQVQDYLDAYKTKLTSVEEYEKKKDSVLKIAEIPNKTDSGDKEEATNLNKVNRIFI